MNLDADLSRWATFREIMAQPEIWRGWVRELTEHVRSVQAWLHDRDYHEIWLCGAGTSAFIGETLSAYLNAPPRRPRFRAIATTDLVGCPANYLRPDEKILVVSFGRSGDSPETLGTLDLLDAHMPGADRLHFTCNRDGALAGRKAPGPGKQQTIVLPDETNDTGFAMTSSYSTMLLSALACLDEAAPLPIGDALSRLADAAEELLAHALSFAAKESSPPERAVFLGSGALTGSARECALKVLELTRGRIATSWDSSLGFRHGPKAFMGDGTKVFLLASNDPHTRRYDLDAAAEIARQFGPASIVTLGSGKDVTFPVPLVGNDAWSSVLYVLAAQVQAVAWSNALGINVDNPFVEGNLSRVVSGVPIYPFEPQAAR